MKKIKLVSFLSLAFIVLRTNSLNAQTLIVTKTGDPIYGYNVSNSGEYYFYQKSEKDNSFIRIDKDEVLMLRDNNGNVIELNTDADANTTQPSAETNMPSSTTKKVSKKKEDLPSDRFPIIPLSETHNDPLAYGNCIYIPTDSPKEYERAGQLTLKKLLNEVWEDMMGDGKQIPPYVIVDKPEQAHFVLQYTLATAGSDCAMLFLRPREYYDVRPQISNFNDHNNIGYNLVMLKALNGGSLLFSGYNDMEDPRINVILGAYIIRYFAGLIGYPNNWKGFWRKYKKKGLFMRPHYAGINFIDFKGHEELTQMYGILDIDEVLEELEQ